MYEIESNSKKDMEELSANERKRGNKITRLAPNGGVELKRNEQEVPFGLFVKFSRSIRRALFLSSLYVILLTVI